MPPCDAAVIFALEEEFVEFHPEISANERVDRDLATGHVFFLFDWPVKNAAPYKCVTTFVGSMGGQDAGQLTHMVLDRYAPKNVIVVGIAGSLSGDVLVGDVVVADQVDDYLQDAKAVDGDLALAGRSYRPNIRINKTIRFFPYTHSTTWTSLIEKSKSELKELLHGQKLDKTATAVLREGTWVHVGHLASGPIVGASAACISDASDERKSYLDQIGSGVFRGFAMHNSIRLLLGLLSNEVLERSERIHQKNSRSVIAEVAVAKEKRDDSDPNALRVFFSSSFLPMREELRAVEQLVEGMGHTCVDNRYFGNYPFTLFKSMNEALRSTDVIVIVIKDDVHIPRRKIVLNDIRAEIKEARSHGVQILAYENLPAVITDEVNSIEMCRLRRMLSNFSTPVSSNDDLMQKLAGDLKRLAHDISAHLIQEASPELVARHLEVLSAIGRKAYDEALELNTTVLGEYPSSMRALYNSACIHSIKAKSESDREKRRLLLLTARHKLADAVDHGILKFIRLSKGCLDRAGAVNLVLNDSDLAPLFGEYAELRPMLRDGKSLRFAASSGGSGCDCGCDAVDVPKDAALSPLQREWLQLVGQ